MAISAKIKESMASSSWIRKMFEEGNRLRKIHGAENVFDLSLGNPCTEPPPAFKKALSELANKEEAGMHRYMSNSGYEFVREKVAQSINKRSSVKLTANNVIMTVGAAGAINVVLKSILDPGDEVIVFSPYFAEYLFYIDNHGGKSVIVPTNDDFTPDLSALEKAISPKTKAVLINTPNNPTGIIYDSKTIDDLCLILKKSQEKHGNDIYLLSDEPYRAISYGAKIPTLFEHYDNSIVVTSHSKDLALPGERIGYIALSPKAADGDLLFSAFTFSIRVLGFVNAPALMQRVVANLQDITVDLEDYRKKRDYMVNTLLDIGYELINPQGAFYLFPKSPIPDDLEFINMMVKKNTLVVPGTGFGKPGYFRISYCVPFETLKKSAPAFKAVFDEIKKGN